MNTLPKIIFFGTDSFSLEALTALVAAGHPIAAVVTKPDSKQGRGHRLTPPVVKVFAADHAIPVWQPNNIKDIISDIQSIERPLGVLSSYGKIIPQKIIDMFSPGIINIHPSLLPQYRGPTPIETAIAHGDSTTGVSIMQLSSGMDAGPVYTATHQPLTGSETSPELYHTMAKLGAALLVDTLPSIIDGSLLPTAQDETLATYTTLLSKDDAYIIPDEITAQQVEQHVRAYLEFPKSKITLHGHTLIITKAHVTDHLEHSLTIACKNNTYLAVDEIIAPNGRRMGAQDFERGYLRSA